MGIGVEIMSLFRKISLQMNAMDKWHEKNGFTLTELLLVIGILAVLATLALPRYFPQSEKARIAEAIGILSAIRQGELAYFLQKGTHLPISSAPGDPGWDKIGMDDPNPSATAATRYFGFSVTVGANPPTFTATATRTQTGVPAAYATNWGTRLITIDQDGTWGPNDVGTCHPMGPATSPAGC